MFKSMSLNNNTLLMNPFYTPQNMMTKILATLAVFFAPIYPAIIAVGILITIDFITGLIAAKKQGVTITSKKMGATVTKMLVYNCLIFAAHLCEIYLFPEIPFLKISLAFLAMTEFTSIAENFEKTTGKNLMILIRTYIDNKFRGFLKK